MNKFRLKKLTAMLALGAFAISLPIGAEARRLHDPKVEAKSEVRYLSEKDDNSIQEKNLLGNVTTYNSGLTREEADAIAPNASYPLTPHEDLAINSRRTRRTKSAEVRVDTIAQKNYNIGAENFSVPQTVSVYDTSIIGTPMASQTQCVKYLLKNNPHPNLNVSPEEIVAFYYEEGAREGIRPDLAFAQALKETGFFRYGGTVTPDQNNYCGLGTTSSRVKGVYFSDPRTGVRAHIQHLLAYSSTRRPTTDIVDPRYSVVRNAYGSRTLGNWSDLDGRWAVPGYGYGRGIMSMFSAILAQ